MLLLKRSHVFRISFWSVSFQGNWIGPKHAASAVWFTGLNAAQAAWKTSKLLRHFNQPRSINIYKILDAIASFTSEIDSNSGFIAIFPHNFWWLCFPSFGSSHINCQRSTSLSSKRERISSKISVALIATNHTVDSSTIVSTPNVYWIFGFHVFFVPAVTRVAKLIICLLFCFPSESEATGIMK